MMNTDITGFDPFPSTLIANPSLRMGNVIAELNTSTSRTTHQHSKPAAVHYTPDYYVLHHVMILLCSLFLPLSTVVYMIMADLKIACPHIDIAS
jgi:hypothetical protein